MTMTAATTITKLEPNDNVCGHRISEFYQTTRLFYPTLLLFLISQVAPTHQSHQLESKPRPRLKQQAANELCRPEDEFQCQLDRKCIPIDFRCDFTEQCSDGEDEFGCSPDRCDFNRDLCNWQNKLRSTNELYAARWRRYFNSIDIIRGKKSQPEVRSQNNIHTGGEFGLQYENTVLSNLKELSSRLKSPHDRFVFVPLALRGASTDLNKIAENKPGVGLSRQPHLSGTSARLSSPLIGQTNSMCQLRFEYSLWNGMRNHEIRGTHERHERTGTGTGKESDNQSRLRSRIELKLIVRESSGENKVLWAGRNDQVSATKGRQSTEWMIEVVELGHRKAIELYFEAQASVYLSTSGEEEIVKVDNIYTLGLHRNMSTGGSMVHGVYNQSVDQTSGFAAIHWLRFQDCAWPQGERYRNSLWSNIWSFVPNEDQEEDESGRDSDELLSDWVNEDDEDVYVPRSRASSSIEHQTIQQSSESPMKKINFGSCPISSEFMCSHNGICIDSFKLCNFVDDCMQSTSELSSSGGKLDSSAATTSSRRLKFKAGSEDESIEGVCKLVPGMENFENLSISSLLLESELMKGKRIPSLQVNSSVTSEAKEQRSQLSASFWSLAGNWPRDKIRIRQATESAKGIDGSCNQVPGITATSTYFPLKDHTLLNDDKGLGHYLALEIPDSTISSLSRGKKINHQEMTTRKRTRTTLPTIYWMYLESPWLRKLGDGLDCRLKFFYNLVAEGKKTSNLAQSLPFRIYLIVEHVTLNNSTEAALDEERTGSSTLSPIPSIQLDSFSYSHSINYDDLIFSSDSDSIEYAGIDFWRENNVNLTNLEEDDIFYIRVAMIAEFKDNESDYIRASLSLDDLSTHLGCSRELKPQNDEFWVKLDSFRLDGNEMPTLDTYFRLDQNDPGSSALSMMTFSRKRKRLNDQPTTPFEPHRLILYVFVILSTIFGIIIIIVFIVVPRVERAVMNYHDQLTMGISDIDDTPRASTINAQNMDRIHQTSSGRDCETCELSTTNTVSSSDWDKSLNLIAGRLMRPSVQINESYMNGSSPITKSAATESSSMDSFVSVNDDKASDYDGNIADGGNNFDCQEGNDTFSASSTTTILTTTTNANTSRDTNKPID